MLGFIEPDSGPRGDHGDDISSIYDAAFALRQLCLVCGGCHLGLWALKPSGAWFADFRVLPAIRHAALSP